MTLKEKLQHTLSTKSEIIFEPSLVLEALNHIGDSDSELRDDLIYSYLAKFVHISEPNDPIFQTVLKTCLNNLSVGLGLIDDTVFIRSFSLLIIVEIMKKAYKTKWMDKIEICSIFKTSLRAMESDVDVRGFILEKGWAHTVAHSADLLFVFSLFDELTEQDHQTMLHLIQSKILNPTYGYHHNEDKRMAKPVESIIQAGKVTQPWVESWLNAFLQNRPNNEQKHVLDSNVRNFLTCLNVRLGNDATIQQLIVSLSR